MKAARKFTLAVKPIPEGYHSITPYLTVRGADRAIDFYRRAFGAEELGRMNGPDGKTVMHAELKIGDSRLFLGDEVPGMDCRSPETLGGSPSGIYLYVRDVDETFRNAVAAGATVKTPRWRTCSGATGPEASWTRSDTPGTWLRAGRTSRRRR